MKQSSWLREPEEFRRWRLGLESTVSDEPSNWPLRLLMAWMLLMWARGDENYRPWWVPVVALVFLVGDGVLFVHRWRNPDSSHDLAETRVGLCGSTVLAGCSLVLALNGSGFGRLGWAAVSVMFLCIGVLHVRRLRATQPQP